MGDIVADLHSIRSRSRNPARAEQAIGNLLLTNSRLLEKDSTSWLNRHVNCNPSIPAFNDETIHD